MKVQQLMTAQVATCRPDDSLHRAAQLMWDHDCGCLPVCEGSRIAGMITDRDVCMSAMLQRRPLTDLPVSDAMATQVVTCRASDSLVNAERIMREARVRRLPVINDEGALIGLISLADLACEAEREQPLQSRRVTGNEIGVTLASICKPRHRPLAA